MRKAFSDIACTACGCVCDDLQVAIEGDRVVDVERACRLAQPYFAAISQSATRPAAAVDGRPSSIDSAIERAVDILRKCRLPLIFGLTHSSTGGQRAAVALAEQIGGTVDTPASCNPDATLAFQSAGQSTCSLGEVRNRADLVIFWRADPLRTHPRHLERYSVEPAGLFVPHGRADRHLVVVDAMPTDTSQVADNFIQIAAGTDVELCAALRQHLAESAQEERNADSPVNEFRALAERMRTCQYGAIFLGTGQGDCNRATIESIIQLVAELNKSTRFTVHFLPDSGGLVGAENVLCWQTGFPFAVSFANGFPQYDPLAFSANSLLETGNVDGCVLIGSELAGRLSPAAQEALRQLPTIALDSPIAEPKLRATVQITTAIYGIHAAGTAYRMDGVPIPLRQILPTHYPTDELVLNTIASRLR